MGRKHSPFVLAVAAAGLLGLPSEGAARAEKPNVLVIGDSISIGYFSELRDALPQARVEQLVEPDATPRNIRSTAFARQYLPAWLAACEARTGVSRWDVIYFNIGLHDLKFVHGFKEVPRAQASRQAVAPWRYEDNLEVVVSLLLPKARTLIFATTTPGVAGGSMEPGQVEIYNLVARRVMAAHGVVVHDLHAVALPGIDAIRPANDVHFTRAGYRRLGRAAAAEIAEALAAQHARQGSG